MSKPNKKRTLALTVLIALVIVVACVFAANWSNKSVVNSFSPATVSLAIVENDTQVSSRTNTLSLDNGSASKKVQIENSATGSNPADEYVRVCIFPKFIVDDGTDTELYVPYSMSAISGNSFTMGDVRFKLADGWSNNWSYNSADGYFYYNEALAPDGVTAPLLASVSIASEKADYYESLGALLRVSVLADAIQTVGGAVEARWGNNIGLVSLDKARPSAAETTKALAATLSLYGVTPRDSAATSSAIVTEYQLAQARKMITSVFIADYTLTDKEESTTENTSENSENSLENSEDNGESLFELTVGGYTDGDTQENSGDIGDSVAEASAE
jgi:hypothetical protein